MLQYYLKNRLPLLKTANESKLFLQREMKMFASVAGPFCRMYPPPPLPPPPPLWAGKNLMCLGMLNWWWKKKYVVCYDHYFSVPHCATNSTWCPPDDCTLCGLVLWDKHSTIDACSEGMFSNVTSPGQRAQRASRSLHLLRWILSICVNTATRQILFYLLFLFDSF